MSKEPNKPTDLLGQTIPLTIERLAYGGDGVGHYDGKVVFVPWSAPGDQLRVAILEDRSRYARGKIIEVEKSSPDRTEPRCDVFGACGACQWQHIEYGAQVRYKEAIFRETLKHVGHIADPVIDPIIPAEQIWEYRQRIQLKADVSGKLGFYAHGSHDVIPFSYCHISDPHLNEAMSNGSLPQESVEIAWDESRQRVLGRRADSTVFQQIHSKQNRKLVETVIEYAGPRAEEAFLELYCGNGNFSLELASRVSRFFAIDQNAEVIGKAGRAARKAGLDGIEFVVGTAEWGLRKIIRGRQHIDTLVLDPPRGGAKDILDLISVLSAHKIIYVSCDPASLARDLRFLTKKGYRLVRARPIDMFPQTYHIESVSELIHM